jgi:hypothetical protein
MQEEIGGDEEGLHLQSDARKGEKGRELQGNL